MKKFITITLCTIAFSIPQFCTAAELDTSILTSPNVSGQQVLLPDQEVVSYGLLPNPFKIITKTATAPIRSARAKLKAVKKAAKLAKKGVNTIKGIDGDGQGKGPSADYEKTPYTKDKYYLVASKDKSSKKSAREKYEDYEFDTESIDTQESPYAKRHTPATATTQQNENITTQTIIKVEKPETTAATAPTEQPKPAVNPTEAPASQVEPTAKTEATPAEQPKPVANPTTAAVPQVEPTIKTEAVPTEQPKPTANTNRIEQKKTIIAENN